MIEPLSTDSPREPSRALDPPALTGPQRVLVEALGGKSTKSDRTIRMYLEALRAIERSDGVEAWHVAAYELREMMGSLPRMLDLPVVTPAQIGDKVRSIADLWKTSAHVSSCRTGANWNGALDEHLKRFLRSAVDFFQWVEDDLPSRRQEAGLVLQRLLPAAFPMPQPLLDKGTLRWKGLVKYFNLLTHHSQEPDGDEFRERLEDLETFLLEHLSPRTFEDQDSIDRLIRDGEAS